jgi:hypothetical protein
MPYDVAAFNFPSQEMITRLVDKHAFDDTDLISPRFMPVDTTSALNSPKLVVWDVLEPAKGMTKTSAYGADPDIVEMRTSATKAAAPLIFRESVLIGEDRLINARKLGSQFERAGEDLVVDAVYGANQRIDARIEKLNFQALSGRIVENGITLVDYDFTAKQLPDVASDPGYGGYYWSDHEHATAISDIYKAVQAFRGTGYKNVTMIAGQNVMNALAMNAQVKSLLAGSAFVNQIGTENLVSFLPQILPARVNEIISTDACYPDEETDEPVPFADPSLCYLIASAPGQQLGAFVSTPHLYSGIGADVEAGRFMKVNYHEQEDVPKVTITSGIFGVPVLYRPDFVVCMKVMA